jgi:sulfite dehydrogenase (cytochrome) subunit B
MNKRSRFAVILYAIFGSAACAAFAADTSSTVKIELPAETARFKSGPGVETAQQSCMTCHSVDYIYMQPPLTKDQWRGEVVKMKNVFGAPFPEGDVDTIVTYLLSQNGKQ